MSIAAAEASTGLLMDERIFVRQRVPDPAPEPVHRQQVRIDERSAGSFVADRLACEAVRWSYRLVGAIDVVRAANLRCLAGYRHPRHGAHVGLAAAVVAAFAGTTVRLLD